MPNGEYTGPHAVIRRYTNADTEGGVGELERRIHGYFLPTISRAPGFMAFYALNAGDEYVTISVFADKPSAEASDELTADFVREWDLTRWLPDPPKIIAGKLGPWVTRPD
jgi:hypothetical protein